MGNDLGMQYIMDGNGNYYTVNGKDQLVVAKDKDEASVFTFVEANQRIGGGKKAKFYHTIPVDEQERLEPEFSVQCAENDGESITEDSTEDPVIFHIVDEQKEKAHELAVLRIMTERFDIEAMEDAFADEVEAIEKLTDCTVTEEIEQ
jgi:hypothetical protein